MWLFINLLLGKKGSPDVTRNEEGQLRADDSYLNKSDFVGLCRGASRTLPSQDFFLRKVSL
jgi:hypothetical protein